MKKRINNKMILILSVLFVGMLLIGSASAADETYYDNITSDSNSVDVMASNDAEQDNALSTNNANEQGVQTAENTNLLGDDNTPGTFNDLNETINKDNTTNKVELTKDYKFDSDSDTITDGIIITRDITIDGGGHTIDASNLARVFYIESGVNSFTLKYWKNH